MTCLFPSHQPELSLVATLYSKVDFIKQLKLKGLLLTEKLTEIARRLAISVSFFFLLFGLVFVQCGYSFVEIRILLSLLSEC